MTYFLAVTADENSKIAFIDALKIEYIFIKDRDKSPKRKPGDKRFLIVGIINGTQFDLWEHCSYEEAQKDLNHTMYLIRKREEPE